ncbi:hypothetical protein GJR88_00637 [Dietzia sp. DQ12-45-1b]|nr:hypothetical protein GJR88_00637 [Dietzia sp. DQ12-45-1b]
MAAEEATVVAPGCPDGLVQREERSEPIPRVGGRNALLDG